MQVSYHPNPNPGVTTLMYVGDAQALDGLWDEYRWPKVALAAGAALLLLHLMRRRR